MKVTMGMGVLACLLGIGLQETIRIDVFLYQTSISVRDQAGHLVSGLNASEFILEEDGVRQPISHFSRETPPISFGILVENSTLNSDLGNDVASGTHLLDTARLIVGRFMQETSPEDEFLLMSFSDSVEIEENFTQDSHQIEERLSKLKNGSLGCMFNCAGRKMSLIRATERALDRLRKSKHARRGLFIIMDPLKRVAVEEETKRLESLRASLRDEKSEVFIYAIPIVLAPRLPGAEWTPPADRPKGASLAEILAVFTQAGGRYFPAYLFDQFVTGLAPSARADELDRAGEFAKEALTELRGGTYALSFYSHQKDPQRKPKIRILNVNPQYQTRIRGVVLQIPKP